jgi:hypothetical protein
VSAPEVFLDRAGLKSWYPSHTACSLVNIQTAIWTLHEIKWNVYEVYWCFIIVNVHTIRGTDTPQVFPLLNVSASSGHLQVRNHLFIFLLLSLHWPLFTHWECVACTVFMWYPVLRNVLNIEYLKYYQKKKYAIERPNVPEDGHIRPKRKGKTYGISVPRIV